MGIPGSSDLAADAARVYREGDFSNAARLFGEASAFFQSKGNDLDAAEMKNNQSVALLQAGDAMASYEAARGTAQIFFAAGDFRRQGMAYGNEATALQTLGRMDAAVESYILSAAALEKAGEDQMRASVLQAVALIHLRRGKVMDALLSLQVGLAGVKHPSLQQKILRGLLRLRV
jgi:tetratricopeptide (TPR) repeat protein